MTVSGGEKMKNWIKRRSLLLLIVAAIALMLQACGTQEDGEPSGELSLINEDNQEVSLTNKDRATVLFHFTEVG